MNLIENCKDFVKNTTHIHGTYGFEAKIQLWKKERNDSLVIFNWYYILNPKEKWTIRAISVYP